MVSRRFSFSRLVDSRWGSVQLTAEPDIGPSAAPGTTFSTSWVSSNPAVVTVGPITGRAVGMRVGSALITANADGTTTITAEETLDSCPTVPTDPIFDMFGKRRR